MAIITRSFDRTHEPAGSGQLSAQPALICHIIYRLAIGGLENGIVNLINNLPADKYRHAIVCVTESSDFRSRIKRADVSIFEIDKRPGKDFRAYDRMRRVLKSIRPRIVHTRNLPALDMLAPAWLVGVRRFVHGEHGLDKLELDGKNFRYNALRRASRLVVDRYITVSNDLKDWLHQCAGIPESRIERIYNGVDTDRFAPEGSILPLPPGFVPPGALVIGAVGRFDPVKNQTGLVAAVTQIVADHPELRERLRLVLVGDGELRRDMESMLADSGLRELAWFGGFRSDMTEVYRALDVFVLPSLREGISNTLLEAMASGRPVIATRVGGNPEIVPDRKGGLLVEPRPEAIAAALLHYLGDPAARQAHGTYSRAHVLSRFSLRSMVSQYDRVYSALT